MLPAWVYVITAAIASNSYSLNKLYPTAAARADLAASGGHNPALVFPTAGSGATRSAR
jgi:hypothetical protein